MLATDLCALWKGLLEKDLKRAVPFWLHLCLTYFFKAHKQLARRDQEIGLQTPFFHSMQTPYRNNVFQTQRCLNVRVTFFTKPLSNRHPCIKSHLTAKLFLFWPTAAPGRESSEDLPSRHSDFGIDDGSSSRISHSLRKEARAAPFNGHAIQKPPRNMGKDYWIDTDLVFFSQTRRFTFRTFRTHLYPILRWYEEELE